MSLLITDWRKAVEAHLRTSFRDDEVVGGSRDGVNQRNKRLIAVWWPGWEQLPRDISLASPTLMIRVFPAKSKLPKTENPRDPEPLEEAAVEIMVAMRPKQKVGDFVPALACGISRVVPVDTPEQWYVEATVTSFTFHLARNAA
jgi:hypothetical protein